jgi:uncharacterized protein YggU (UPF0235/DUF167 family)
LGVKKRDVVIVSGAGARTKRVEIVGLSREEVDRRLAAALGGR